MSEETDRPRAPAFAWDEWYASIGGRTISIPEVNECLRQIHEEQLPRFDGSVSEERRDFAPPIQGARARRRLTI